MARKHLGVDRGTSEIGTSLTAPALQNGWTARAGYQAPQYGLNEDGEVHLRGSLAAGTVTASTLLFTLPVGLRPAAKVQFKVMEDGATPAARVINIDVDGTVKLGPFAFTAATTFSLDGIYFLAA